MRTLTWGNVEMSDIHNHEQARGDRLCVDNLPFRVGACGQLEGAGKIPPNGTFVIGYEVAI